MARKMFCDRCDKEIKPRNLFHPKSSRHYDTVLKITFERWELSTRKHELCYDCAQALLDFMNNGETKKVSEVHD